MVSTNIVRTLLERGWVRVVGHRDVPGKPAMFGTTREFLDYFGLKKLEDLPPLAELKDGLPELSPQTDLIESLEAAARGELPAGGGRRATSRIRSTAMSEQDSADEDAGDDDTMDADAVPASANDSDPVERSIRRRSAIGRNHPAARLGCRAGRIGLGRPRSAATTQGLERCPNESKRRSRMRVSARAGRSSVGSSTAASRSTAESPSSAIRSADASEFASTAGQSSLPRSRRGRSISISRTTRTRSRARADDGPDSEPLLELPRPRHGRWIDVGALDPNSSGLIVLTTDGDLAFRLTRPATVVEREYAVRVLGEPSPEQLRDLEVGVQLDEGVARLASIEQAGGGANNRWYHVVLREGRHRELRAALGAVGLAVNRVIRVRFGPIELGKLRRGASRPLNVEEIDGLYALGGLAPPKPSHAKRSTARAGGVQVRTHGSRGSRAQGRR